MIRLLLLSLLICIPAASLAQGDFDLPWEGKIGYRDLQPIRMSTIFADDESPDLLLIYGPEAIPVTVVPELVADENGRIGGIISLSWFGDDDNPRLLELPASGRLRMRSRSSGVLFIYSQQSEFLDEWDHAIDIRAAGPQGDIRIIGTSRGESMEDPTQSRVWKMEMISRIEGLGPATGISEFVFGNEAISRFTTTEGIFGAEDTRLRQWSGDAPLVFPNGERRPGGSISMETRYLQPEIDGNIAGSFLLRAANGHTRIAVSGWLPVSYDEAAFAVATGNFDFATLGLMPTNRLFATPAYTTHERLRWSDEFWDLGQINPPLPDW